MEEQVLFFNNQEELRQWFEKNQQQKESIWIEFLKKDKSALSHGNALEQALCYGWIDSIIKRIDEKKYKMKFSPRRNNSKWSESNKITVQRLIKEGKMTKYGLAAIDEAKKNGNWYKNNTPVITREIMDTLRNELKNKTELLPEYDKLSNSVKKTYAFYYSDAKREETRKKRFQIIIEHILGKKGIL